MLGAQETPRRTVSVGRGERGDEPGQALAGVASATCPPRGRGNRPSTQLPGPSAAPRSLSSWRSPLDRLINLHLHAGTAQPAAAAFLVPCRGPQAAAYAFIRPVRLPSSPLVLPCIEVFVVLAAAARRRQGSRWRAVGCWCSGKRRGELAQSGGAERGDEPGQALAGRG